MNLFQLLTGPDSPRELVASANFVVDTARLRWLRSFHAETLTRLHGARIGLAIRNPRVMAEALILLDGWCEALVLLPTDLRGDQMDGFVRQTGASSLLTDANFAIEHSVASGVSAACAAPRWATTWYLPTSGTSGDAKLIAHTTATLACTVKRDSAFGARLRWGLMYDLHRFAGLQVFLQALAGGSTLVVDEAEDADLDARLDGFTRQRVNAISATPTQWRRILMSRAMDALDLRIVSLGGEIVTQEVLDALVERWPTARITHIYASTEAGVGFAVADGIEGFPADWLADPVRGISVDPVSGEMLLRVPTLGDRGAQTVRTGDAIEVQGGRARFRGRLNGSINVGGNKVMPEEVERVILAFPGVAAAMVKGRRSSLVGTLVVADVVLWPAVGEVAAVRGDLLAHCRARLAPYKVPALVNFVDSIETGSNGKALRN